MDSSLIAAFCGLGGVLVGALASSLTTYIVQRQETKRKLTDTLIQAAVTNWCKAQERAKEMKLPLQPLDVFIINPFEVGCRRFFFRHGTDFPYDGKP